MVDRGKKCTHNKEPQEHSPQPTEAHATRCERTFVGEEVSDGKGDGELEGVTDGSPRQEICTVAFTDVDPVGSVEVNRMLVLPLTAAPAGMVTLVSRRACRPFRSCESGKGGWCVHSG
jgi:hypothetical protein